MATSLPLLLFPRAKTIAQSKGKGVPPKKIHFPEHEKQVVRLGKQLTTLQKGFNSYKASISGSLAGLEPETVLVIEIVGNVKDFRQAVEAVIGLEWLGEYDLDNISPDENFFEPNAEGGASSKALQGRMFLSFGNLTGMKELLSLWEQWKSKKRLPRGKTKWEHVFKQMIEIRRWGVEETLRETGMLARWRDLFDPINPDQPVYCQIELFYRKSKVMRMQAERNVARLLEDVGGQQLGGFIDMEEIAFHAVKAELPAQCIGQLLNDLNSDTHNTDIDLFKFQGVMYFRPTGQSLAVTEDGEGVEAEVLEGVVVELPSSSLPPVAAILDGAPNLQHQALKDRLLFDDPDNLSGKYQPGERKHGTTMASLVVHGEMLDGQSDPLPRLVYMLPIMEPDSQSNPQNRFEHVPDDVFFEDRIERAVKRMFEGEGALPAQAPRVCVINLSIGDMERPFIHMPSPWARLLDWLSWKYRVLFCVSAGNYLEPMDIGLPITEFKALTENEQVKHVLTCIQKQLSERRILSPAESINSISVGAMHSDGVDRYSRGARIDLLPKTSLFSPAARLGHGFHRSIKPEIMFPGGRQLYRVPALDSETSYKLEHSGVAPGLKVAWDSKQVGNLSQTAYTRGTSNATALATRGAARIYEVLDTLRTEREEGIPQNLISVLIKALLVHGAKQNDDARKTIAATLSTPENSRKTKEMVSRYLGYGSVEIERVLACTEQRATLLGCDEIHEGEVHEYRLPLPPSLSSDQTWRRMMVTLAWFSPVNSGHRNFREAKLSLSPVGSWGDLPLKLARQNGDHHQVLRGTVQHEVVEGTEQIAAYQDGESILLHVACKKDAATRLDVAIPYGLAVTLEVAEDVQIPIYQQLLARLDPVEVDRG